MIKKAYVDTAQGQIHYRYSLPKSDKGVSTLVLLHQTPSSSVMYESLMAELTEDHKLFAFDFPGFGESSQLSIPMTIAAVAECLLEAMCQLQIEDYLLFGHHTGASIAVEMANYQPLAVQALVLSGPPLLSPELKQLLPTKATAIPPMATGAHLTEMWDRIASKDANAGVDLINREVTLALALGERYPEAYTAVIDYPMEERLQSLRVPTLIFAGTKDPLYGQLDATNRLITNCQQFTLDSAGTYACETHTEQIAGEIRQFFSTL